MDVSNWGYDNMETSKPGSSCVFSGHFLDVFRLTLVGIAGFMVSACNKVAFEKNVSSQERASAFCEGAKPNAGLRFTSPQSNQLTPANVAIEGLCSGSASVEISGGALADALSVACMNGKFAATARLADGDGFKDLSLSQAGISEKDYRCFNMDGTPPAVAFANAAKSELVAKLDPQFSGSCEPGLPVLVTHDKSDAKVTVDCVNGRFAGSLSLAAGDGAKDLTATQKDSVGNVGTSQKQFVVDMTAPAVRITGPARGSFVRTEAVVTGPCESGLDVRLTGSAVMGGNPVNAACTNGSFAVSLPLEGPDTALDFIAEQVDPAGNRGADQGLVNRDATPPRVTIASPSPDYASRTGVTLTGNCETGINVVISGGGITAPASVACTNGGYSAPVTFAGTDGVKNVTVSQTDPAGNMGLADRNFRRDTAPPMVTIVAPNAGGTYSSSTVTVSGICETGASAVQISGAGIQGVSSASCMAGGYAGTVNLTNGDGVKQILVQQTDMAGNVGSDARSINRDSSAPNIRITSPAANTATSSALVVGGSCETGLTVTLAGAGAAAPVNTACNMSLFSASVTLAPGDGAKMISAAQTDAAGNTGTDYRTFVLDATAPAVTILNPATGSMVKQAAITVNGACETNINVVLTGDLTASKSVACTAGAYSTNVTLTNPEGNKMIRATQTDAAGNVGSAQSSFTFESGTPLTEVFTTDNMNGKVDILFVDDNSASMDPEQQALGTKFPAFTASLLGLDWQIGITTTDCSSGPWGICGSLLQMAGTTSYILNNQVPQFEKIFLDTIVRPETVNCVASGSCPAGNEESLRASIAAMDKRSGVNAAFFRADAALAIVMLTDEDEQSTAPATATTPQNVIDHFKGIWGTAKQLRTYAITTLNGDSQCLKTQQDQQGGIGSYGSYPISLASMTGGISVSICAPDYSVTLQQIGSDLLKLTNTVTLTQTPISGSVNVTLAPNQTVTWKVSGKSVVFSQPLQPGTKITVKYRY